MYVELNSQICFHVVILPRIEEALGGHYFVIKIYLENLIPSLLVQYLHHEFFIQCIMFN